MVGMPAARVSDMHTCPMCMGAQLPILPPCQPNVLIGGMPAARMFDLCACIAPIPIPVDMIIFGSLNVLIGGMPAARMLDPTVKGGMIMKGEPSVLIGMAGFSLAGLLGFGTPACAVLKQQLADLQQAQDDGKMAAAVYGDPQDVLPNNTVKASQADLEFLGLSDGENDMTRIKDSNFKSEVYVQTINGEKTYIVAFKGTDMGSGEDWGTNVDQALGKETPYYNQAMLIGRTASDAAPGKVRYVGHSLGGGLATAAAGMSNSPATTFNSAGLNQSTLARQGGKATGEGVNAYYVKGEILSGLQDNTPASKAVGTRHGLDPAPSTLKEMAIKAGAGVVGALFSGPFGPVAGGLGAAKLADAGMLHMMSSMQKAMDQEAKRLKDDMDKNGCN